MNDLRTVACQRCSRRKQRCDRKLPSCNQCVRANTPCRDGKAERMMTRTEVGIVQPKGYIELLEDRLQHLRTLAEQEDSVQSWQRNTQAGEEHIEGTATSDGLAVSQANEDSQVTNNEGMLRGQDGQSRRHSPDIGLLSLSAMAEPNCRAAEFLTGISMPGLIRAMTESYGGNPQRISRIDALWDGIAKDIRQANDKVPDRLYLPEEDALKYVKTYYEVVDYRYPHLPNSSVDLGINAITRTNEADYEAMLAQNPAKVFMAYMVLAITPLVSDAYPIAQASFISIHILSKALAILDKVFQLEDGVDIIYCLILLVLFSLHSSAAGSTWHLVGVAMKKCIALGFHREVLQTRQTTSEEDLEQRRWAFWLCYFLDRLVSCALDRPFGINDRDITIELPGTRKPFSVNITPSQNRHLHLYRYALLQSKIAENRAKQPLTYQLNHLLHWETSAPLSQEPVPIELEEHSISLLNTLALRAMTDQIIFATFDGVVFAPSPQAQSDHTDPAAALRVTPSSTIYTPISFRELMNCATAVIQSLNRRSMQRRSTLSWITGYTSIRASIALLYCLASLKLSASDTNDRDAHFCEDHIDIGMEVLSVVSRQFSIMQEYRSLIATMKSAIKENVYNVADRDFRRQRMLDASDMIGPSNIYLLTKKVIDLLS